MNAPSATTSFPAYFNMRRDGFLLGVIATGSQVLLLRELISSLQGDELFIGTALCGWLLWGALGAYLGAKRLSVVSNVTLFALAALLLPFVIVAARLSPMLVTETVGESVSFSYAALLSFIITLPGAFICGCLFSAIVRREGNDATSMLHVYYSEGVGAFVAGALVSLLTSNNVSTFSAGGALSLALLATLMLWSRLSPAARILAALAGTGAVLGCIMTGPGFDRIIDGFKCAPYEVVASFDTPYSHQTILRRGGARVLLTDNMVESVEDDIQTAENLLLPPLAYVPEARNILLFGQVDLTVMPVLDSLPNLFITEVDTRTPLGNRPGGFNSEGKSFQYVQNDPVAFLRLTTSGSFDVVIFAIDESGSYRGLRLMTSSTLAHIRRVLKRRGVLHLVTTYNSGEYISAEDERLLSTIRATLEDVFPSVIVWPGSSTLFLAGDSTLTALSPDSIAGRLSRLKYQPQFINESYLPDRLSSRQIERIDNATRKSSQANSLERPLLANLQIVSRSRAFATDRWVGKLLARRWAWGILMTGAAILLLVFSFVGLKKRRLSGALFFAAGFISLGLELLSFYVYQSIIGILYSHLSLLVGTFMLGLAIGTWSTARIRPKLLAPGALALLFATILVFMATCLGIPQGAALAYHVAFQFVVAFCTGALFVAATRYYYGETTGQGSIGYAIELSGSSLSALVTMPLLLPTIGLKWLLLASAILTGFLLVCALVRNRSWGKA
jgi:hypothetical protein